MSHEINKVLLQAILSILLPAVSTGLMIKLLKNFFVTNKLSQLKKLLLQIIISVLLPALSTGLLLQLFKRL